MAKDGDLVDFVAHLLEKDPHKRLGGSAAAPAGERGEQAFGAFHPWIIAADAVGRHPWLRAGGQHDVRVEGGALPVRSALIGDGVQVPWKPSLEGPDDVSLFEAIDE